MANDNILQPRTILAIDDHELVRVGLRSVLLQHFGERYRVEEAQSLEEALVCLKERAGDIFLILLDLHLGDTRGLAGLALLRQRYPDLPVIVVSGLQDEKVREKAAMLGAVAFVNKGGDAGSLAGLLEAVDALARGQLPRPPASGAQQPGTCAGSVDASRLSGVALSKRQIQVLELILAGHDNSQIAEETGLALGSVKNCVSSIFLVFNVRSRAELVGLFAG
ncbi:response regulator transcription factor [Noviherbaspirillum aridicola]|uniref:DNA-binding response regulator n=1 Tax=Noviherbaspirillum aridicola TaxID=2849687 RepID=A0ABQ4PZ79_9BURK|nr:response regulator transcription factor [Noviherbaspirillum aridicola]GIZ50205.1 DNA-binding response regulator [Noviherbaspirillum aridicola]